MKKRVLFTSAVVALTMGLSLDAQAQNWHIRGINAQLPFDSGVFVGGSTVRQAARQLTPNRFQLGFNGLRGVVNAAQPSALQARATGRATTKALRNLGSVEGPTVTFDSGSYNAKPSTLVGSLRSVAQPVAAGINAGGNILTAGLNAAGGFFGGTVPVLFGAPQPQ